MRGFFRRRNKEQKEVLSPAETAKFVRDVQLDVIDFGVIASDTAIPRETHRKANKLPQLLRYSPTVLKHFQTLRSILSAPQEFRVTNDPAAYNSDDETIGDIIFSGDDKVQFYEFSPHLISPYLNSWKDRGSSESRIQRLFLSIGYDNQSGDQLWKVDYSFIDMDSTSPQSVGSGSDLYPERYMVMRFWYSPKRLSGEYFLKNFPASKKTKEFLTYHGDKNEDGFRCFLYEYDSLAHAAYEKEARHLRPGLVEKHVKFLEEKGKVTFAIVEIGTIEINGEKHWIYTGTEQAKVSVKEEKSVREGALQTSHQLKT